MSLPSSWVGHSTDSQLEVSPSGELQHTDRSLSWGTLIPCESGCFELVSMLIDENQLKLALPSCSSATKGSGFQFLTMAPLNKKKYYARFGDFQECCK